MKAEQQFATSISDTDFAQIEAEGYPWFGLVMERIHLDYQLDAIEYGLVFQTALETAHRMQNGMTMNLDTFSSANFGHRLGFLDLHMNHLVTDQIGEFPFPDIVYHVTGTRGAEAILGGGSILPMRDHYLERVVTDKGMTIPIIPAFLKAIGVETGALEDNVFSGPEVDADQIVLMSENRQKGVEYHRELHDLFFDENGKKDDHEIALSPRLGTILRAIEAGVKIPEDPELTRLVDDYVADFARITHVREGWLVEVDRKLRGELLPGDQENIYGNVRSILTLSHPTFSFRTLFESISFKEDFHPKSPVVLEVDTWELVGELTIDGLFVIPASNRPVNSILPTQSITPGSVRRIFFHPDDLTQYDGSGVPVASFDDIPDEAWLGGVHWREADPDPWNPLCDIRYDHQDEMTFAQGVRQGMFAPLKGDNQNGRGVPNPYFLKVFGESVISRGDKLQDDPAFSVNLGWVFGHVPGLSFLFEDERLRA